MIDRVGSVTELGLRLEDEVIVCARNQNRARHSASTLACQLDREDRMLPQPSYQARREAGVDVLDDDDGRRETPWKIRQDRRETLKDGWVTATPKST